jgi:hypothetical protein
LLKARVRKTQHKFTYRFDPNSEWAIACRSIVYRGLSPQPLKISPKHEGILFSNVAKRDRACCARAANGQAIVAPPKSVMNSRRFN